MALMTCPDCSREVSDQAPACPGCGRPIAPPIIPRQAQAPPPVVDITGAWCPHCKNRNSHKTTDGKSCVFWIFVIVSMGLALIMIPFLPKTWHCNVCGNEWKA